MAFSAQHRFALGPLAAAALLAWLSTVSAARDTVPPPPPLPAEGVTSERPAPPPAESTVTGKCTTCGVIRSIREVTREKKSRELPAYVASPQYLDTRAYSPPMVGPVVGLSFGRGGESRSYVGAVGSPEMQARLKEIIYEVIVRFEDGRFGLYELTDLQSFRVDDRVRVRNNELELMPR